MTDVAIAVVVVESNQIVCDDGIRNGNLCECWWLFFLWNLNDLTMIMITQVLLLGNVNQTIVGRPLISGAKVRARVEEQTLDAKIDVFKKKRRKNYRRWNGFRRQVTVLRVTEIVPVSA